MELTATEILKFKNVTTAKLKSKAQYVFNKWIRNRDAGKGCISCPSPDFQDAGHYYSAGHHNNIRFNEDNVHGQCRRCNRFLHGNLIEYRRGLIKRIGAERLVQLDILSKQRSLFKNDRFFYIGVLKKYKL